MNPSRDENSNSASASRFSSFSAFWPYYLSQHALPLTRRIHFVGTTLSIASVLALIVTGNPIFAALALVSGYGPAWFAHFFIEHNRPATFRYPIFSLAADFKMWFLMLTRHKLM